MLILDDNRCIIFSVGFLRISLNRVRVRQFTSNLEQDLLDDLVSANMYVSGAYSCLLEDIYVHSLPLPLARSATPSGGLDGRDGLCVLLTVTKNTMVRERV